MLVAVVELWVVAVDRTTAVACDDWVLVGSRAVLTVRLVEIGAAAGDAADRPAGEVRLDDVVEVSAGFAVHPTTDTAATAAIAAQPANETHPPRRRRTG